MTTSGPDGTTREETSGPRPPGAAPGWPGVESVTALVTLALYEDVGPGDVTTETTVPLEGQGRARIVAKADGTLSGLPMLSAVYDRLGGAIAIDLTATDGDGVRPGQELARLSGALRTLLVGERVALNFLARLSGVATLTARFVEAVQGTPARILDTRKTTPGQRALEKYAVRCGGGDNHRLGLHDAILVKENHIAAAGGLEAAIAATRSAPPGISVQVEVQSVEEAERAVSAGVSRLLLDNMTPEMVADTRSRLGGGLELEVSGGLSLTNVRAYAEAGADRLSIGALTHSAPALDLSMLMELS